MYRKLLFPPVCILLVLLYSCNRTDSIIWQIGKDDNSSNEFALAPDQYSRFLEKDFGWEDKFHLIGYSKEDESWPYVLPGPSNEWGGTSGTAGWRSHTLNILFSLKKPPKNSGCTLHIDLLKYDGNDPPVLKVLVNGKHYKYFLPGSDQIVTPEESENFTEGLKIDIPVASNILKAGGNEISLSIIQGSWIMFDYINLTGPAKIQSRHKYGIFIRNIEPASYEIHNSDGSYQPLLIDIEHLNGISPVSVLLDGDTILSEFVEKGRYVFEAAMAAVENKQESNYGIWSGNKRLGKGTVIRQAHPEVTPADYVNTKTGTAHSRWMIAPGPWMPFSMVKISPDNQNKGWQAGYDPIFESIAGFSHIHEWTMAGLLFMPVNGDLVTKGGDEKEPDTGYRSRFNPETEECRTGYYKVELSDYDILAELTSTTRCSFQKYTFPDSTEGSRVLIDLKIPAEYDYELEEVFIEQSGENTISGYSRQVSNDVWYGGVTQEYTVHFFIEFDQAITNFGTWSEKGIRKEKLLHLRKPEDAGAFAEFNTDNNQVVKVRTGISYVSIGNAKLNLNKEVTEKFGWNFNAVRNYNKDEWNDLFRRVEVSSNDRREKQRFYTNMYRSLCSRNIFSDVDGRWIGPFERVRQMSNPDLPALGCDAFWNTFWNLNQFWNLVTPEWTNRWVNSQLSMYDAAGWLAKGPAGMEFIPVMVAEHEIPLIVSAYQMGIRDFDINKSYEAVVKMQTSQARKVGGGFAGNRDLEPYLKYQYVPHDKGRFSNGLEYSFDDWTVSQFALALGKEQDHNRFLERGYFWKNSIDTSSGYARMKDSQGNWLTDFDPYQSGRNHHYVEANAWQMTFFVPQDPVSLINHIGKERFVKRLDWGFNESYKWRFNAPNDQYWDYPVMQGNQQSMHFAFLFNWADQPWLTQKWSRAILERYYGYGVSNAYLGDEDQGQMSAWFMMASLGLFQTDGGCNIEPVYEIASPVFQKVEIDLGMKYGRGDKFIIKANNVSRLNKYVQSASLNGRVLNDFKFPARELLKGGTLLLEMGPEPNKYWGITDSENENW